MTVKELIPAASLVVARCDLSVIKRFIEEHHYSHSVNGVKVSFCYSVTHCGELVGGVLFGAMSTTAWRKFASSEREVLELRRLVLHDAAGRNSESRVVGLCLRSIKKLSPETSVIVSYADPAHGHSGVIYRASNFVHIGMSSKDLGYKDIETGKTYHSRALRTKYKGDYKPFVKRLRERLADGLLLPVVLPAKHCFIYNLRSR